MVPYLRAQKYTNQNTNKVVRIMSRRRAINPTRPIGITLKQSLISEIDSYLSYSQSRSLFISNCVERYLKNTPDIELIKTNSLLYELINREDISDSFKLVLKTYLDETYKSRNLPESGKK